MSVREAYQKKAEAQLEQWKAELAKLQARGTEVAADARLEYERLLEQARGKTDEVESRLGELARAEDKAWDDLKAGFEAAWDDLEKAVRTAVDRFR